jgi:hypothetical protein
MSTELGVVGYHTITDFEPLDIHAKCCYNFDGFVARNK